MSLSVSNTSPRPTASSRNILLGNKRQKLSAAPADMPQESISWMAPTVKIEETSGSMGEDAHPHPSTEQNGGGFLCNRNNPLPLPVGSSVAEPLPPARSARKQNGLQQQRRPSARAQAPAPKDGAAETSVREHDEAYFRAYSHIGVHEEMIKDRVRTDAYRDAIYMHADAIRDKVVVDVGCGTGILSIFCALAGARKVYAVDASDIAVQAQEVVKANGLADVITVVLGRVEDAEIDEEVDVIVSEWMGYMLLYESMLPSVIYARDRWLKPGGIILPSHATLYMAPITNGERYAESVDFWRNVYGIDMSAMLPLAKQCAFEEPCVESITAENVLSRPIVVKHIDCRKVSIGDLEVVTTNFCATSMMMASLHGFALWFEVTFGGQAQQDVEAPRPRVSLDSSQSGKEQHSESKDVETVRKARGNETLTLSTAPEENRTHWQQTILYIYDPIEVGQDQVISGSISLSQNKENSRFLNVHLDYASGGRHCVKECVMR